MERIGIFALSAMKGRWGNYMQINKGSYRHSTFEKETEMKNFKSFTEVANEKVLKTYHLTTNGKDTICGVKSEDRVHVTYQDKILDDGKWCTPCKEFYKVNRSVDIMRNKDFVHNIISQVETIILSKMDKIPAGWDGFELRLFIKEHFDQVVWHLGKHDIEAMKSFSKRKHEYDNEIKVHALI
jgi:hypothetical protein